jgi:hypothetical protein
VAELVECGERHQHHVGMHLGRSRRRLGNAERRAARPDLSLV